MFKARPLKVDHSTGTRKRLENLTQRKLINLAYVVNNPDFELQNFTVEQLVDVVYGWASELSQPITLEREMLCGMVSERIKDKREMFKKALDTVLHLQNEKYRVQKGPDWGRRLADYLSDQRELEFKGGTYSEQTLTKVERQVLLILRASQPFIDFPLSMKHLDLDNLEILAPSAAVLHTEGKPSFQGTSGA